MSNGSKKGTFTFPCLNSMFSAVHLLIYYFFLLSFSQPHFCFVVCFKKKKKTAFIFRDKHATSSNCWLSPLTIPLQLLSLAKYLAKCQHRALACFKRELSFYLFICFFFLYPCASKTVRFERKVLQVFLYYLSSL